MFSRETRPCESTLNPHLREKKISWLLKALMLIPVLFLLSCSTPLSQNKSMDSSAKTAGGEKVQEEKPRPGDVKIVNGVEMIYEKNSHFGWGPDEPEYMWVRKDQR